MKKLVTVMTIGWILVLVLCGMALTGCSKNKVDIGVDIDNEVAVEVDLDMQETGIILCEEPEPVEEFEYYTVRTWAEHRDCLWNIALRTWGNPYLYVIIYQDNAEQIDNLDLIYPGQVLILRNLDSD